MRSMNRWLEVIVIACGISLLALAGLAQAAHEKTFSSPQHASNALYVAVESGDQAQIVAVLGGDMQLVSTDNNSNDQQERQTFAKKYQEMHRLMRRSDGAMILYVGADNWPFPVPIVKKNGRWYFDADKGSKEILYRRVGANEISGQGDTDQPFDGYYFRKLSASDGAAYVAYPAQYRSSGVMTFVVTTDGKVYQKDLGPKTESLAKEIKDWKADKDWAPAAE